MYLMNRKIVNKLTREYEMRKLSIFVRAEVWPAGADLEEGGGSGVAAPLLTKK